MKSWPNSLTIASLRPVAQLANCILHTLHGVHTSKAQTQGGECRAVPCLYWERLLLVPLVLSITFWVDGCPLTLPWTTVLQRGCILTTGMSTPPKTGAIYDEPTKFFYAFRAKQKFKYYITSIQCIMPLSCIILGQARIMPRH